MAQSIIDFIEENYQELLQFCVRLNGNWADAEDVLQTVAAKICKRQDELQDVVHCKAYLMTCIRHASLNLWRTHARQNMSGADFETVSNYYPDAKPKDAFTYFEWTESLVSNLSVYDEQYRKAFIAYYIDQEPLEYVAESLGLTKRQTTKKFEVMRRYLKKHYQHLYIQMSILLSM